MINDYERSFPVDIHVPSPKKVGWRVIDSLLDNLVDVIDSIEDILDAIAKNTQSNLKITKVHCGKIERINGDLATTKVILVLA